MAASAPIHAFLEFFQPFTPVILILTEQLLKTLWEKEKLLVMNNFSFSPQCLILIQIILFPFVDIYDTISLFAAEFEEPKIGISGKELTSTSHNILSNGCFHT